ncbi:uncharacterized protein LOC111831936 [Capsella rubella]|uniref:uncharacterized protein LOC111831936 n=1 Tax=Capsella rubella TaxID=81985 RepID=UPI000CD4AE14|nr:uncharacterized protein LOC111831936 [Capsella rubella]
MLELYSVCGEWQQKVNGGWHFVLDSQKGGSLSEVDENVTFKTLAEMVIEDFGLDCVITELKLSYALSPSLKMKNPPPLYLRNDRQVQTFIRKVQEDFKFNRLCVTVCQPIENVESNIQNNFSETNQCKDSLLLSKGVASSSSGFSQLKVCQPIENVESTIQNNFSETNQCKDSLLLLKGVASSSYGFSQLKANQKSSDTGIPTSVLQSDTLSTAEQRFPDCIPIGYTHHT